MIRFSSLILLLLALFPENSVSQTAAERGWKFLETNQFDFAGLAFEKSSPDDVDYSRALLGQFFLQSLKKDHEAAFQSLVSFSERAENSNPYFFSVWINETINTVRDRRNPAFPAILNKMIRKPDATGHVAAFAHESLGGWYLETGDYDRAIAHYDSMNTIDDWMIIGPFDNISGSGFDKAFGPENGFNAKQTFDGIGKIAVKWIPVPPLRMDRWVDFESYYGRARAVYYANTFIKSPSEQSVLLKTGTSGSLKVFLNDQEVLSVADENNNDLDTYSIETSLQKGWNRILVKVGASEIDKNNFMLRVTDLKGNPIPGLEVSVDSESYKKGKAPVKPVPVFAEAWFEEQISKNPDHLENYLFYAEVLSRNDKADEAEAIVAKGLKRFPESVLLLLRQTEAFIRGEKYDEYRTVYNRFDKMGVPFPDLTMYKYYEAMRNEKYEEAKALLNTYQESTVDGEQEYYLLAHYYKGRNLKDELKAVRREAMQKYPLEWGFLDSWAADNLQTQTGIDEVISEIEKYQKRKITATTLFTHAVMLFRSGKIDEYEKAMEAVVKHAPANADYYYKWGSFYFYLQNYEKAAEKLLGAIRLSPFNSDYLGSLGEIYRILGDKEKAINYFSEAIRINPVSYGYREKLTDLKQDESPFKAFNSWNLDSIITNAPPMDKGNSRGAVILAEDTRRVLYDHGASESLNDMVIKVYNDRGVENFKEYWIDYNSAGQDLIIEKKVVIKPNGDEIDADSDDNHVVFKSLEPGDVIHLRWKIQYYYRGKLSEHLWETIHLNYFVPTLNRRYALLTPSDFKFAHKSFRGAPEPAKRKWNKFTVHEWQVKNEAAIESEDYSPSLEDIGKKVEISSIPDWGFLVNWYLDLTANKTKVTPEIRQVLAEIFPDGIKGTPEEKLKAIHLYVTEKIKYSSVSFRQSGHIPQSAREVCVTKIGDCKDMATLAITLLREAGVPSWYVLVNTWDEGFYENALPSIIFNHAIVAVELPDRMIYVDMTGNNYPVGTVPVLDQDALFLLIKPGVIQPGYLKKEWFDKDVVTREILAEMTEDNRIKVTEHSERTASLSARLRQGWRELNEEERQEQFIRNNPEFKNMRIVSLDFGNLADISPVVKTKYVFEADDFSTTVAGFQLIKIPWSDPFEAADVFSAESRTYPLIFNMETDVQKETVRLKFPDGLKPVEIPETVNLSSPIADFSLIFKKDGSDLVAEKTLTYKARKVDPKDYSLVRTFFKAVQKAEETQILLK